MSAVDLEKARQAKNAYARAWRQKNPEKARENNLRYWARRAEREAQAAEQNAEGGNNNAADATVSENR